MSKVCVNDGCRVRHRGIQGDCYLTLTPRSLYLQQYDLSEAWSPTVGTRLGSRSILLFISLTCTCTLLSRAQNTPLGVVQQANLAHLGQGVVTEGATVYGGEMLSTDSGGTLELRVANSHFVLQESSRASFFPRPKGSVVELSDGVLTFRRDAGGSDIEVVASDVRIAPEGDGAVMGQVTILSPCKVKVTSLLGQLDVISGKEKRTIKEKETYSVIPEVSVFDVRARVSPDDAEYHRSHSHKACGAGYIPRGGGPISAGTSRFLLLAGTVAGVATGVGVYLALESPDKP
jgi:hypothetical protein